MTSTPAALTERWRANLGECPPVGYELRSYLPRRWVRFHSLPGSRRYARDASEQAEVLRRALLTLTELVEADAQDGSAAQVLVITHSWSTSAQVTPRSAQLAGLLPADFWTSVLLDDSDPEDESWTHLWATSTYLDDPGLRGALHLVADDQERLIVSSEEFSWLYAPYDGGADTIARSAAHRDLLKAAHPDWLSTHPDGL